MAPTTTVVTKKAGARCCAGQSTTGHSPDLLRHEPRRQTARNRRGQGPPLVHRRAVPPGTEVKAVCAAPAVCGFCPGGDGGGAVGVVQYGARFALPRPFRPNAHRKRDDLAIYFALTGVCQSQDINDLYLLNSLFWKTRFQRMPRRSSMRHL
jgi:hypothetical protein